MTQSLRSQFGDEPKKQSGGKTMALIGQLVLLAITIACSGVALWWLMSDASGEYFAQDRSLGQVTLSLMRKPANFVGDITVGRELPAKIIGGELKNNSDLILTFQQSSQNAGETQPFRFDGKIIGIFLKGTLYKNGNAFPLSLERNSLASLQQQIQAHLP